MAHQIVYISNALGTLILDSADSGAMLFLRCAFNHMKQRAICAALQRPVIGHISPEVKNIIFADSGVTRLVSPGVATEGVTCFFPLNN